MKQGMHHILFSQSSVAIFDLHNLVMGIRHQKSVKKILTELCRTQKDTQFQIQEIATSLE